MEDFILTLRNELKENSDEKTRQSSQHFFKETIKVYGLKSSDVRRISKKYFKEIKEKPKEEIFALSEELWKSGILEETFIACDWTYSLHKDFTVNDFETFERWIKTYINNWASCDTFCNHTMGSFIDKYPEYIEKLKDFAKSNNRWVRRTAAVSLIIPAREGRYLKEIFEIADILLLDKDDMVQKGYGWMLKEASKPYQKEIFDFVVSNKKIMPRTALRYAIEKMPKELKQNAMKK